MPPFLKLGYSPFFVNEEWGLCLRFFYLDSSIEVKHVPRRAVAFAFRTMR